MKTAGASSVVFVVDNDFGALGTVLYLLHGQPVAERATVLLPPEAYALHAPGLVVKCRPYRSEADILEASRSAEVVCLFSGYLMPFQGVLSARGGLRRLVRTLRMRGCRVATSDPYLGTFRVMMDTDIPGRRHALEQRLRRAALPGAGWLARLARAWEERNWRRLIRSVADSLAECVHVFPVPMPLEGATSRASFFNPRYFAGRELAPRERAKWLFVLAQFDLRYLEEKYGREGFLDQVAAKLRETRAAGREVTFIGPASVCDELHARLGDAPGLTLLTRCAFTDFERHLFEAEIAFYWQIFSTSAFMRLWSGLPVFFLDRGHNAKILPPLYDAGLARYYVAGEPRYVDPRAALSAPDLRALRPAFEQEARAARAVLERLPAPGEMIARIVAEAPRVATERTPARAGPPPAG